MSKSILSAALVGLLCVAFAGCGKKEPAPPAKGPAPAATKPPAPVAAAVEDPIVQGKARDVACGEVVVAKGSKEFVYKNTR